MLSKARQCRGVLAFKTFFERIVLQCSDDGLIDGRKLFADSSIVQADRSNNSVVKTDSLNTKPASDYRI